VFLLGEFAQDIDLLKLVLISVPLLQLVDDKASLLAYRRCLFAVVLPKNGIG